MVYKATEDVVRRVMPLLDQLATRAIDKARLLQYLSARVGADWDVLEFLGTEIEAEPALGATEQVYRFRDRGQQAEHRIHYPACLPLDLEPLVIAEYKRLAMDRPLTLMDEPLFLHFYGESHCARCRWRGPGNEQIHRECRFAGKPVNFEPEPDMM